MNRWYAALCKPRQEMVAEANLANQGFAVYLPRLKNRHRRAGRWVDRVEPLFPRYLFVAAGLESQSLAPIRSTRGVSGLVRFGGQPATVAVKAEADIPDLKMHAVMTLRKNTDPSLPASHTIDLRLTFADGAEIKGIKDMRVPMMRRDDPPSQDALSGVRVKISDSYFLVGLNRGDAELAHNIDLVANRGWFDFPMLLNDDRIAKLTFEKGADGERIVNEALAAWK